MNIYNHKRRVLIVGRGAWTENESTLTSIFTSFDPEQLAYVCIETRKPDFTRCQYHYQISEVAMVRHFICWGTQTGRMLMSKKDEIPTKNEKQEKAVLDYVRAHRSITLLFFRELLWCIGHWKNRRLAQFIREFQPDVVFCIGDPLPLINRLQRYIIKKADKPGVLFMMDDIWSYKSCHRTTSRIYRWILRRQVKPLISLCKAHFAISPKMKQEYDEEFGINCQILTKSINSNPIEEVQIPLHSPLILVYTGNLLYGRLDTLVRIADTVQQINAKAGVPIALMRIYTQTTLNETVKARLRCENACEVLKAVPYEQLSEIYNQSDIVLFVESLEECYKYVARLSFSTKLTDYMGSGKCIFAVGVADIAPIEYLREKDAAVVCCSYDEIQEKLQWLLSNKREIMRLGKVAYEVGQRYHGTIVMNKRLIRTINQL